ncbi:hypothetical protein WJX64_07645 [Leifsonia sp. YIM 134122]|uniref:FHA domain-containing protein n=1 Tax=Leifsonia stereocauli TaxID=3134136 RepID=A0ABU9W345_9MICO
MNCLICGAVLPPGAMFCGDCGSSTTATPRSRTRPDPRPGDTTIIEPLRPGGATPGAVVGPPVVPAAPPVPAADSAFSPGVPTSSDGADAGSAASVPQTSPTGAHEPESVDPAPATFVLVFSTGEQWAVSGTGLIGRRPLPQPTEYHDEIIAVADRGLSVSKTHLEFGQHDGELWVSDRFSGNGTIIRRPREAPMRCDPGRRYLVPRGSRVDIGEQHFTVA